MRIGLILLGLLIGAINLQAQDMDSLMQAGLNQLENKSFLEAEHSFNRAIELDKKNADAWYGRGLAQFEQKKYNEALGAFIESYDRSKNPQAKYYQGVIHYKYKVLIVKVPQVIIIMMNHQALLLVVDIKAHYVKQYQKEVQN